MTGLDKNYRMFLDVSVTIELPHEVIICVHIYLDCTTEYESCLLFYLSIAKALPRTGFSLTQRNVGLLFIGTRQK